MTNKSIFNKSMSTQKTTL